MAGVVATIIERDDHILLLQRSQQIDYLPGCWDLPGGYIEPGETPAEAASREILEETGLVVDPEWLREIKEDRLSRYRRIQGERVRAYLFQTPHARGQVTLSWEHDEGAWVPLGRALCNGPAILRDFHLVPGAEKAIKVFYHIYP
jgi:8-oxo-dGTP pyrophosphatase MutT (NUDIX family)